MVIVLVHKKLTCATMEIVLVHTKTNLCYNGNISSTHKN